MNLKRIAAALALVAGLLTGTTAYAGSMNDTGHDTMMHGQQEGRFGGPVYSGKPNLVATASLVAAGGGVGNYSTATALVSMLGKDTVNAEVAKLTKQYGKDEV